MGNQQNRMPESVLRDIKSMNIYMVIFAGIGILGAYRDLKDVISELRANAFFGLLSFAQVAGTLYALYLLINSRKLLKQFAETQDSDVFHSAMVNTAQYWKIQSLVLFLLIVTLFLGGWNFNWTF